MSYNTGNEKWQKLSSKNPGGVLKDIDNDAAQDLLDMMVKDSAFEFSNGVERYVESERKYKKARARIKKLVGTDEELKSAFEDYEYWTDMKKKSVRAIKNEFLFLNGGRNVKPPIDGMYVMTELIKTVLTRMDDEAYEEAMDMLAIYRETRKKQKKKLEE